MSDWLLLRPLPLFRQIIFLESVRKDAATVDAIEIKINKIIPLKEAQQEMENAMFEKALELFPNKSVAADVLGIHRTTFSRKINKPEE